MRGSQTPGNSAKMVSNPLVGLSSDMRLRERERNGEVCAGTVTDVAASTRQELATSTNTRKCRRKSASKIGWFTSATVCNEKRPLQLPVKTKVQAKFTLAIGMNCRIVSRSQRNPLSAIPLVMLRSWENTDLGSCIN